MIDLETRFSRLNIKVAVLFFYLRYRPIRCWILLPLLLNELRFKLKQIEELKYQAVFWHYLLSVSLIEERWRQFGKRLSKRSHRRVKANTWLVADVPDFLLNWVTPDSRHVGLDIDDHGHLLPQARTLKAKMVSTELGC